MAGNTREVDIYESGRAEDKIAALSGIAAALLLHALVYFAAPDRFAEYETATRGGDELKLEILPPEISKRPPEFVEANPFANTEKPDSPDAPDSFTDQRASDIIPDPSSKSKMPYVEGEIKDGKRLSKAQALRKTYSIRNNPFKLSRDPSNSPPAYPSSPSRFRPFQPPRGNPARIPPKSRRSRKGQKSARRARKTAYQSRKPQAKKMPFQPTSRTTQALQTKNLPPQAAGSKQ